jgi:hypothetical protein
MFRLAADGLFAFSRLPMRLAVGAGLVGLGVSLAACVLAWGCCESAGGMATLVLALAVGVHLAGAAVLTAVGVAGEYVARGYEQSLGRPVYLVKEESPFPRRLSGDRPPAAGAA